MAGIAKIPKINVVNPTKAHTSTLFFFHGSGSSGDDVKEWVNILHRDEFKLPHVKVVYPSAPLQPYTPNRGQASNVWFDRKRISINAPEDVESIDSMCGSVSKLIEAEISNGIPSNRIVVGGFSMGGALSMYVTYKYKPSVAGCFAMSSFLNKNSFIYEHLKGTSGANAAPLLQFHGTADDLVPITWGQETHEQLKRLGVKGQFVPLNNAGHELTRTEISRFKEWVLEILPEK